MMLKSLVLSVTALATLLGPPVPAHAAGASAVTGELAGYAETRFYGIFGLDPALAAAAPLAGALGVHPEDRWGLVARVRPTLKLHVGDDVTCVATVDGHASFGFFERPQRRVPDLVSLERAYATLRAGRFDLTAGKHLLRWGHGLVFNPTDLLNSGARPLADLRAELPGTWAVKALAALDDTMNVTLAAAVPDARCCAPVAVGRFDATAGATDLALELAWDARTGSLVVGLDVKGEWEVGLWAEATYSAVLKDNGAASHYDAEAGVDYSFAVLDQLYIALEWLHQGDGVTGDPAAALIGPRPDLRTRQFLGRDYAVAAVRLAVDAQWQLQTLHVTHVRDGTGMTVPQVTWLPAGAWELVAGAAVTHGPSGGEYRLSVPDAPSIPPALRGASLRPRVIAWLWARWYY